MKPAFLINSMYMKFISAWCISKAMTIPQYGILFYVIFTHSILIREKNCLSWKGIVSFNKGNETINLVHFEILIKLTLLFGVPDCCTSPGSVACWRTVCCSVGLLAGSCRRCKSLSCLSTTASLIFPPTTGIFTTGRLVRACRHSYVYVRLT
jgi:hypothetical protein